ncbi:MAG: hypothetical protein JST75_18625 [Bacteroidetes bacterium]|nr:hypothetical protein [Bacteroidota bacterium]
MKIRLIFIFLILYVSITNAQETQVLHAGKDLTDYYTYRFPSFSDGIIFLKNGEQSAAKMNFNTFLWQMQLASPAGDTLTIGSPEEIDSIILNNHLFFYNKEYIEVIAGSDSLRLTAVQRVVHIDVIVTSALGESLRPAQGSGYEPFIVTGSKQLELANDLSVKKETIYSLVTKNGPVIPASRSNFLKTFANDKTSIDSFLKSTKINFNKRDDLEKLFLFCISRKM